MRSWRYFQNHTVVLALVFLNLGCAPTATESIVPARPETEAIQDAPSDTIFVWLFREANFSGGGRIHQLKIDAQIIGDLTNDNYYVITLWPGTYHFSVFLPEETLFGQHAPAMSFGRQFHFRPSDAGRAFACQYTDGLGTRGFTLTERKDASEIVPGRRLARRLNERDTAQVTTLFEGIYNGPSANRKPHGAGTLTWTDGSRYHGVFEHGEATCAGRFYYPDGRIFMGNFYRARPGDFGVMMQPDGRILFSGPFDEEQPGGIGLRTGADGPQFCLYDHGNDITQSFRQLAQEALDAEDKESIKDFMQREEKLRQCISGLKDSLNHLKAPGLENETGSDGRKNPQVLNKEILRLEKSLQRIQRTGDQDLKEFVADLEATRFQRELTKAKLLQQDHDESIGREQTWCEEEALLGRRPCSCAPLAADFEQWSACEKPLKKWYAP